MGECPLWLRFLDRITGGDRTMVAYLQRVAGYCLTGNAEAQVVFFLYGSGANGKSIFIRVLGAILGDYAATAPLETFMASATERHSTELAGLQGARMVSVAETEVGRQWAESRLKVGDRRREGPGPLHAAGLLRVSAVVQAHRRRQPQAGHALDRRGDAPAAPARAVRRHHPAERTRPPALRRSLRGARRDHGLGARGLPGVAERKGWRHRRRSSGRRATTSRRRTSSANGSPARCDTDPAAVTSSRLLFASWSTFAAEHGHPAGTAKALTQDLLKRGYAAGRARDGSRAIVGIGLRGASRMNRHEHAWGAFAEVCDVLPLREAALQIGHGAMKPPRVRWNTTEVRVERFVRLAQRLELPVYGFEVRGRDVTVLTRPREDGSDGAPTESRPRRTLVPRQRGQAAARASPSQNASDLNDLFS